MQLTIVLATNGVGLSLPEQSTQLQATQGEVSLAFINDPAFHLDVIYWHQDVPHEAAQVSLLGNNKAWNKRSLPLFFRMCSINSVRMTARTRSPSCTS